jgi:hypothetical protein
MMLRSISVKLAFKDDMKEDLKKPFPVGCHIIFYTAVEVIKLKLSRHDCDRMVVGLTTSYASSDYHC